MPLAELISTVYDKGVTTKTVQGKWQKMIDEFSTEIDVLINVAINDIEKIDSNVSRAIEAFRNGTIDVVPGGGGKYGEILLDKPIIKPKNEKVITLDNF
jgi:PHP family Zn ribbon phosphoesterase